MAYTLGQRIGRRVVVGFDAYGYTLLRCDCGGAGHIAPSTHVFRRLDHDYCQRRDCHEHAAITAGLVVGSRLGRLVAVSDRSLATCGYYMRTWRCDCGNTVRMAEQRAVRMQGCRRHGCVPRVWKRGHRTGPFAHLPKATILAARAAYRSALHRGDLTRPATCSACGRAAKIDGHHEDYTKPLDVVWLCKWCHGSAHYRLKERARRDARKAQREQQTSEPDAAE